MKAELGLLFVRHLTSIRKSKEHARESTLPIKVPGQVSDCLSERGAEGRNRTTDTSIFNAVLYP